MSQKIMLNDEGVRLIGVSYTDLTPEKLYQVVANLTIADVTYALVKNDKGCTQCVRPDHYLDVLNVFTVGQEREVP